MVLSIAIENLEVYLPQVDGFNYCFSMLVIYRYICQKVDGFKYCSFNANNL